MAAAISCYTALRDQLAIRPLECTTVLYKRVRCMAYTRCLRFVSICVSYSSLTRVVVDTFGGCVLRVVEGQQRLRLLHGNGHFEAGKTRNMCTICSHDGHPTLCYTRSLQASQQWKRRSYNVNAPAL